MQHNEECNAYKVQAQIQEFLNKKTKTSEEVKTDMIEYLTLEGFSLTKNSEDSIELFHKHYGQITIKEGAHNLNAQDIANTYSYPCDCDHERLLEVVFLHESEEDLNKLKSEMEFRKFLFTKREDFIKTLDENKKLLNFEIHTFGHDTIKYMKV